MVQNGRGRLPAGRVQNTVSVNLYSWVFELIYVQSLCNLIALVGDRRLVRWDSWSSMYSQSLAVTTPFLITSVCREVVTLLQFARSVSNLVEQLSIDSTV
jgi:hypothetical protein